MDINLARFDLVSIRLAVLCAELGSLSAASKEVHCSLSTGSYRLSTLEDTLGKPLFTRDRRGLQTTAAGELFVRHAKAILRSIEVMSLQIAMVPTEVPLGSNYPNVHVNPYAAVADRLITSTC